MDWSAETILRWVIRMSVGFLVITFVGIGVGVYALTSRPVVVEPAPPAAEVGPGQAGYCSDSGRP